MTTHTGFTLYAVDYHIRVVCDTCAWQVDIPIDGAESADADLDLDANAFDLADAAAAEHAAAHAA